MPTDTSDKSEPVPSFDGKVPGWTPEVGTRIAHVIEHVGGIKAASDFLDIKAETIANWREGRTRTPLFSMQMLADRAGVTLDWLMTGNAVASQPRDQLDALPPAIDAELLGRVTEAVVRLYKEEGAAPSPRNLGEIAARIYEDVAAVGPDHAERNGALKVVVEQERRRLKNKAEKPLKSKFSA